MKWPFKRKTEPVPPVPLWDDIHGGTASFGKIAPALRDLDRRIRKIEAFLVLDDD